jgi:topoisomerase-4 subunit A
MDETTLVSSEPVTVILSEKGWVRSAKGHDIDPTALSYRAGDGFLAAAKGKSTQLAVFLDASGRAYTLPTHTLPSARGQGEPLTGRLSPPPGASFVGLMLGQPDDLYILATDAGYGFIVTLNDLYTRQRAGKVTLTLPPGSQVVAPIPVFHPDGPPDRVAVVSTAGRLLVFPLSELPHLAKGKGYKLIGLSTAAADGQGETVAAMACFRSDQPLTLHCGQRHLTLKPADTARYTGMRGRRGARLPRGFQRVDRLSVNTATPATELAATGTL